MASSATVRKSRRLLKAFTVLAVAIATLVAAEIAARWLGLGRPVLYYNAAWGGVRPLPDQRVVRWRGATVTVDAHGYRSASGPKPGALRILYLGDSVTWGGTGLDDSLTFPEVAADVLRARGSPVYAMNAGVNGTALRNHAEVFLRHADSVDMLVWLFPWGDATRAYATVGPLMPARFTPTFALVEVADHLIFRFWIGALRKRASPDRAFRRPGFPAGRRDLFDRVTAEHEARNREAFRIVVEEARRRGVPLVVGVTPYLVGDRLERPPDEAAALLREALGPGVTRLDVSEALTRATSDLRDLFLDHVHFSAEGHRVVGEALGQALLANVSNPPTDTADRPNPTSF